MDLQAAAYAFGGVNALYLLARAADVSLREHRWRVHLATLPTAAPGPVLDALEDRFVGCLVGGAVGDALGRMTESLPRWVVKGRFGTVRDFHPGLLRWVRSTGSVTDDTQLTLAIAGAVGADGHLSEAELTRRFAQWFDHRVGPGLATIGSVRRLRRGSPWLVAGDRKSAGNGGVMRVAPVGLVWCHTPETRDVEAAISSVGTHAHPLALRGAQVVASLVAMAISRIGESPAGLVAALAAAEPNGPWREALLAVVALNGVPTPEGLRRTGTTGFVIETVKASLFLFQSLGDDPEAALVAAANGGGDTDSIGAVLGNVIGAWHGYAALPRRWTSVVQGHGALIAEGRRLVQVHRGVVGRLT